MTAEGRELLALADEAKSLGNMSLADFNISAAWRFMKKVEVALRSAAFPEQAGPSWEETEITKAISLIWRDLASDLEVVLDAYLSAMESQNPDAMAEKREVLERILWDDKGTIIDALRLAAKPADDGVREALAKCVSIAKSFKYSEETKAVTNGARTYGNDEACERIAAAIVAYSSLTAKPAMREAIIEECALIGAVCCDVNHQPRLGTEVARSIRALQQHPKPGDVK